MAAWTIDAIPDLSGRRAIVTGANSGIGYQAALRLASRGATVVFACRSAERGGAALDRLRGEAAARDNKPVDDLQWERRYWRWPAYGQSKVANLLFTRELGRRYPGLVSVAAHPGSHHPLRERPRGGPPPVGGF